jgi:toxin ParE1/3/4
MAHAVVFSPEAEAQLVSLRRYITDQASLSVARRFTDAIVEHCLGLDIFPNRGVPRDDLRPGLRTTSFRGRVTIAYVVDVDRVIILAILYAGQDVNAFFRDL